MGPLPRSARHGTGLGVVHVTLHVALKRVFELMTTEAILAKIRLADEAMRPLTGGAAPRIAVSALNPHAGEDGLFGDEEQTIISPAVALAAARGSMSRGRFPTTRSFITHWPARTTPWWRCIMTRGTSRLKTAGFDRAVNVTLGLPIVRTSVAHGTAFDIAWKGVADPSSLIAAVRVAARIVAGKCTPRDESCTGRSHRGQGHTGCACSRKTL